MRKIYTNHKLCSGCKACSIACSIAHFGTADETRGAIQVQRNPVEGFEMQAVCRQCDEPECVAACMAVALTREPGTGRVVLDSDRCIGCWMCVMVCPHQGIQPDHKEGKSIICDQCEDRKKPACVMVCSTGAVAFVETEVEVAG